MIVQDSQPEGFKFTTGTKGDVSVIYAPRQIGISAIALERGFIWLKDEKSQLHFTASEGHLTFTDDFGKSFVYKVEGVYATLFGMAYLLERQSALPRMTEAEKAAERAEAIEKARAAGNFEPESSEATDGKPWAGWSKHEPVAAAVAEAASHITMDEAWPASNMRDYFAEHVEAAAQEDDEELILIDLNETVTVSYPEHDVVFEGVSDAYLDDGALVIEGEDDELIFPAPGWLYWSAKPAQHA